MELGRFMAAKDGFWVSAGSSAFLALISLIFPMTPAGRTLGLITGVA
jgi:hypothetical protein